MHTGAGLFVRDVCEGLARGRASGRGRALVAEHHVRLRCGEPSVSQGLAQADAVDDGLHTLGSDQPPGATCAARSSHSTRVGALSPACPRAGPSRSLMNSAWASWDSHTSKTTQPSALAPPAW